MGQNIPKESEVCRNRCEDVYQVARVPCSGTRYDQESGKIVYDVYEVTDDEPADERIARLLNEIAYDGHEGIEMEADFPCNNSG